MFLGLFGMAAFANPPSVHGNAVTLTATHVAGGTLGTTSTPQAGQTFNVAFGIRTPVAGSGSFSGWLMDWAFNNAHVQLVSIENHIGPQLIVTGHVGGVITPATIAQINTNGIITTTASGTRTAGIDFFTATFALTATGAAQEEVRFWIPDIVTPGANMVSFGEGASLRQYLNGVASVPAQYLWNAAFGPRIGSPMLVSLAVDAVDELLRDVNVAANVPPNRGNLETLIRDNWGTPGLGLNPDHLPELTPGDMNRILDEVIAGRVPGEYPTRDAIRDVINNVVRDVLGLTEGARIQFHITEAPSGLIAPMSYPSLVDFGMTNATISAGGTYTMTVWLQSFTDIEHLSIPIDFNPDLVTINSVVRGPAFPANIDGFEAPGFGGLTGATTGPIADRGWDADIINASGRLFLTLNVPSGVDTLTIPEMMAATPATHHFFTVSFTVSEDAADFATAANQIVLFTQGAQRSYDNGLHSSGSLFGTEAMPAAGANFTEIDYIGSVTWGSAPVVFPPFTFNRAPEIQIRDGATNVTGETSTHNLETATVPLVRTTWVGDYTGPTTSRLYRNGVLVPNPATYNISILPGGTFVFPVGANPAAEGSYRIVSQITSTGAEADHFVNVIDTTAIFIYIRGTAQLFGKTRSNVYNAAGAVVWNFEANRMFIDMGIEVELINTATGERIGEPVTTTAANTTGAFATLEQNFNLRVPVDAATRALLQSNGGTTLRFTRRGEATMPRANAAGVVTANTVVDDAYLVTDVLLVGNASSQIVNGAVINMTRSTVLYAGAFWEADRVDMRDVALVRALIGNTEPYFRRVNINEYWGVNAGDLNSVSRSVNGHDRIAAPLRANYAFTVAP